MSKCTDERDDFWDLSRIVPKKKTKPSTFNTSTFVTEHEIAGGDNALRSRKDNNRLTILDMVKPAGASSEKSYAPENTGLIKRVTVKNFADRYDFYGNFRKAAVVYYDYKTDKCDFVPFYSYMPQYSQLTSEQKQYYFYFRDMVRRGKFIKSDYSYLYLLVYEILNMPDYLPPSEGVVLLCKLWREYRGALPRIDSYFAVWIQDYCLVHRIACPMEYISEFIFDVIYASDFKEFYLSEMGVGADSATDAMIAYLSDYDWRKCRYRTSENKEMYFKHMIGAMTEVLVVLFGGNDFSVPHGSPKVIERDAFPHSLCTHAVKCKLSIEYIPLSQDIGIRHTVTMSVRYCENKLRALLGIKSRLSIKDLSDVYKRIIDAYFDELVKKETAKRRSVELPEYERLYDAPSVEISFSGADEIERASWSTTARLVSDADYTTNDADDPEGLSDIELPCVSEQSVVSEGLSQKINYDAKSEAEYSANDILSAISEIDSGELELSDQQINALKEILSGSNNVNDLSLIDDISKINEYFTDLLGDIVIESDGEAFRIIDDYREDVREWLLNHGK